MKLIIEMQFSTGTLHTAVLDPAVTVMSLACHPFLIRQCED